MMVSTYRTWKNYRSDRTACLLMKNNFAALRHSSSFHLLHHHPACLFLYADPSSSSSNSGCFGGSIALFCFVFALALGLASHHHALLVPRRREKKSPTQKDRTTSRQKHTEKHTETQKTSLILQFTRKKQASKQKSKSNPF